VSHIKRSRCVAHQVELGISVGLSFSLEHAGHGISMSFPVGSPVPVLELLAVSSFPPATITVAARAWLRLRFLVVSRALSVRLCLRCVNLLVG
jgi:hypothetical protein